jgi:hydroxymethylpyrimidine/phosphomethylpyrimidine kinase
MGAPVLTPWSVAITIAGSDSGGGAGVQADLKTFGAFGVWGTCAITAVTAQNTTGVSDISLVPAATVRSQIAAVASDMHLSAAKTGMLGDVSVIEEVAAAVSDFEIAPLVVDPVMVASTGAVLLEPGAVAVLLATLVPMCALITPNIPEAEALLGRAIRSESEMGSAARELGALGARAVLVKGGHATGRRARDVLWSEEGTNWLDGPRLDTRNTHGSGCVLSAAITAQLALGSDLLDACATAKRFVTTAMSAGGGPGRGVRAVDPSRGHWG